MKMKTLFIYFVLVNLLLISNVSSKKKKEKPFELTEEAMKKLDEDLDDYEEDHSMDDMMQKNVAEYVKEQKWTPEQEIDKETFRKMFIYVLQKGALKNGSTELLKKLCDAIVSKHGEKIVVKNLKKYYNMTELGLTYSSLFYRSVTNTDL